MQKWTNAVIHINRINEKDNVIVSEDAGKKNQNMKQSLTPIHGKNFKHIRNKTCFLLHKGIYEKHITKIIFNDNWLFPYKLV